MSRIGHRDIPGTDERLQAAADCAAAAH